MLASASASEWGCCGAAGGAFPLAGCYNDELPLPAGAQVARVAEGRRASLAPGAAGEQGAGTAALQLWQTSRGRSDV